MRRGLSGSALAGALLLVGLLPDALAFRLARVERVGFVLIIGVLFLLPWLAREIGLDFNPIEIIIGWPVSFLADMIFTVTGLT